MSSAPTFDASPYELDQQQLQARFDAFVVPHIFRRAQPRAGRAPAAVLLGGQPGAGKTKAQQRVQEFYGNRHLAAIIGDDLRPFHPAYRQMLQDDPAHMPDATAQAAGKWVEMAIRYAREHGFDVLVEGTFRNPALPIAEARAFKEAGFDTHLVALAVPEVVSRASTLDRFVEGMREDGFARWTPYWAHEAGWTGVPKTVEAASASNNVDRVTIVTRGGDVLSDEYRSDGISRASLALEAGRFLAFDDVDADVWLRNFHAQVRFLADEGHLVAPMAPLLQHLADDAEQLGRIAAPQPNSTPRNAVITRLLRTRGLIDRVDPEAQDRPRALEQRVTVLSRNYLAAPATEPDTLQTRLARLQPDVNAGEPALPRPGDAGPRITAD